MRSEQESCRYEMAYAVQFQHLREAIDEVRERVVRLEGILGRGMLLLVANLAGVVIMLAERLFRL